MIKNRKLDHLGLFTNDIDATVKWYCDVLGFSLIGDFVGADGTVVKFIRNESGICYELISPPEGFPALYDGRIDHLSYVSDDIEADYAYCMQQGYRCTTGCVQDLKTFWEKGSRYFKIGSPTGEEIEFCQILK